VYLFKRAGDIYVDFCGKSNNRKSRRKRSLLPRKLRYCPRNAEYISPAVI